MTTDLERHRPADAADAAGYLEQMATGLGVEIDADHRRRLPRTAGPRPGVGRPRSVHRRAGRSGRARPHRPGRPPALTRSVPRARIRPHDRQHLPPGGHGRAQLPRSPCRPGLPTSPARPRDTRRAGVLTDRLLRAASGRSAPVRPLGRGRSRAGAGQRFDRPVPQPLRRHGDHGGRPRPDRPTGQRMARSLRRRNLDRSRPGSGRDRSVRAPVPGRSCRVDRPGRPRHASSWDPGAGNRATRPGRRRTGGPSRAIDRSHRRAGPYRPSPSSISWSPPD